MDKSVAKRFILNRYDSDIIYVSNDIYNLMDINEDDIAFIYAVIDTSEGENVLDMDYSYSGEPIIMGTRFRMHIDSYMKFNNDKELKYI